MSRTTDELLRDALFHLELAERYSAGDLRDQQVIDAVCLRLSAGIEVLNRLDAKVCDQLFGDDWTAMWGMRNRIAHGYLLVDFDIVRATVTDELPGIVRRIRQVNGPTESR